LNLLKIPFEGILLGRRFLSLEIIFYLRYHLPLIVIANRVACLRRQFLGMSNLFEYEEAGRLRRSAKIVSKKHSSGVGIHACVPILFSFVFRLFVTFVRYWGHNLCGSGSFGGLVQYSGEDTARHLGQHHE
jgi:hypothetical protein